MAIDQDCTETQVIVVGAGPVGLLLAGELRLAGADVVVLDRLTAPTAESRASSLHARTVEILDSRGLLERLGDVPRENAGHFGGIPLDLGLPGPYPGQWKVAQTRLEEVLGEWAADLGADIRRGHELTGLTTTADGALATVRTESGRELAFRAPYLVGCDGEDSAVRRLGGFGFPGTDAGRELLRADVAGIDIPNRRFERLAGGLAIAARRPDGVTRVMVHEFGARPRAGQPAFEEVADAWKRITGEDIGSGTPLWVNSFGDASRQAAEYRLGPLLLAGDAAHQQMPIGGQSLNLGLQDAFNLGWKLGARIAGHGTEELLDSYHAERHPVGKAVQGNVRTQAMLLLGGPEVDAVREVFAELTASENVRTHLAGLISGLSVRHAVGDGDEGDEDGGGSGLLGLRVPHWGVTTAEGGTDTFELLRPGRGLLLLPPGDEARRAELAETAAPWAGRVRTVAAASVTADPVTADPVTAVLVRPDGHVVWADGPDAGPLAGALGRWFGPERTGEPAVRPTAPAAAGAPAALLTAPAAVPARTGAGAERLTGRTALVTGSSRGMGRAAAMRLAEEGALVAVHYNQDEAAAHEVVASVEKDGGRAFALRTELGVDGDAETLFTALEAELLDRTGSTDLHILVNNAGVMGGVPADEVTPEQFDRIFAVNAKAPFFLIQRALRNMPDGGRIINISSGLTRFANPDEIAYAMSKGALEQLALHFAKALGPRGITINSVAPGITRNGSPVFDIPEAVEYMAGLSAFNRVGEPEDVADVVAFLATDEARWITGSFVDATGGTLLG
ncbi:SDR family oxidoreductase [Streptomyces sp. WAC07149]|uniref:SDR family oxidoreductase n=1 Tax=Streptomyces sp. WAC07149 TaxID=2487425 RepID=UPI000F782674|nr:SDR family oxidoreductase [Streptomyces sp. WAC07149]RST05377.1 SDR family oxidoreductase [Streptomyces sp. WAC07149]